MSRRLAEYSDGELARRASAGSEDACRALMTRHQHRVYRLVRSTIGDADEALDVTQNAFVAAFEALARYDPERPFSHWIARIALNKCRDWSRRRMVRRFLTLAAPLHEAEQVPDPAVPIDAALDERRELARVSRMIARLPASLKEPLLLRTIEQLSEAETAAVLGISTKAVETRVYRARKKLEQLLRG